jgi:hypothetical protein
MSERATITDPAAALRVVRAMKVAFIVSAILFLSIVIKIPANATQPPDPNVELAITGVALAMVVLGFVFPRMLERIAQRAPRNTVQTTPVQRWFTRSLIGLAFLEACSLFGVTLHFLGAGIRRSELLIGVGIIATVFFSVGTPPESEEESSRQS